MGSLNLTNGGSLSGSTGNAKNAIADAAANAVRQLVLSVLGNFGS